VPGGSHGPDRKTSLMIGRVGTIAKEGRDSHSRRRPQALTFSRRISDLDRFGCEVNKQIRVLNGLKPIDRTVVLCRIQLLNYRTVNWRRCERAPARTQDGLHHGQPREHEETGLRRIPLTTRRSPRLCRGIAETSSLRDMR
jgi:hypothetical protein